MTVSCFNIRLLRAFRSLLRVYIYLYPLPKFIRLVYNINKKTKKIYFSIYNSITLNAIEPLYLKYLVYIPLSSLLLNINLKRLKSLTIKI